MTLAELEQRVSVYWKGYGSYKVVIMYRNNVYSSIAHDSQLWDTLQGAKSGYTKKQALQIFYNSCKRDNNLR